MRNTYKRLGYGFKTAGLAITGVVVSTLSSLAASDTNAVAQFDIAKDTFDYAKPIGLGIMGTFLAVGIVRLVWKRFAR